jgi:predicted RNA binding protein YcfA (HicA-like mRNA interferase family)
VPKVRDAIRLVENDGWRIVEIRGSHRQYKHPRKTGRVTISGNSGRDIPIGTWKSILKQAGLDEEGT